ncbi:hypothetical protein I308_100968 [Cryptococcus tetragattii IND107]|uniref:Uncharacterized protein n=1 Tax=Cryptococcus tetragattii IND107 TaxID=1296105 RepID=A0ABR3BZJ9_9TREE
MSSSSSSKPSGSSSSPSSSKPSSSSSSSTSTPKPSSPLPVPTISANAWMSFFLFCCLVLIILQGPLGLTGEGALPGAAQWAQWPNFGGEWWTGWGGLGSGLGLGGAPGCVGVVAGMVPWCQPQVQQSPPQLPLTPPLPQVQIQQIIQNSPPLPPPHYPPPRQRIVSYQPAARAGSQMGGQGGFSTSEGGGGWSWYANGPSPASPGDVMRQYTYPRGQYYPGQPRSVQYQRPGLQLQVTTGPQQPVSNQPYTYNNYPQPSQYRCTIYQPWFCVPIFAYAQSYPPGGVGSVYEPPRAYAYRYLQPYSYVHPHRHYQNGQHHLIHPERPANEYAPAYQYPYQQTGAGGNIQAQVQRQGGQPIRAVYPPPQQAVPCPPQAVPVHPPIGVTPDSLGGLANLENAFYPLLVGAIVLLVIFDYMS